MTKLNVSLTQSFRLTSDGERQFIVEQLVTVDPTKAPGWEKRKLADPTLSGETRKEWRQLDAYYPMTTRGLAAAIDFVKLRQSVEDAAATGDAVTLDVFARIIEGHSEELTGAVSGVMGTQIFEEVGV